MSGAADVPAVLAVLPVQRVAVPVYMRTTAVSTLATDGITL
jgi:hypothetical protein